MPNSIKLIACMILPSCINIINITIVLSSHYLNHHQHCVLQVAYPIEPGHKNAYLITNNSAASCS